MNLFCFTLDGSTDSIYEPPYHNQGIYEVLPRCGYSPALLGQTPGWGGSDPCISPDVSQTHQQNRNNRRSHTPLPALDNGDIDGGDEKAAQPESGVADGDLPTQSAGSDLRTAEPHRRLRFHRLLPVKKASQSDAGKGKIVPESDDSKTHVAWMADSPLMSCMQGLARRSGKNSRRRQDKHKNGRVGNTEEKREREDDDEGNPGEGLWSGGPRCRHWSPVGLPHTWTAASGHAPRRGASGEPRRHVYHGGLVSRTAQGDPCGGVAGGLESRRPRGSSPSPAAPSMRDEEDTAGSTQTHREPDDSTPSDTTCGTDKAGERPPLKNKEMEKGDTQDKVNGGHVFTGGQPRCSSNSLESLYSLKSGQSSSSGVTSGSTCSSNRNSLRLEEDRLHPRQFCARARVHTDFVPSPYDTESLRLKVGDVIHVIAKPTMGIWRGMLNGEIGSFKFIYVDVLEDRESQKYQRHKPCPKSRPEILEELLKHHSLEECCSILRLHVYQAAEELARLREHHHLTRLSEIGPDERRRLLAAVEMLQEAQRGSEWDQGSETPTESSMLDPRTRPRDSGCHMTSCSDTGKDDSEINLPFIYPPTLDQISAV